MIPVLLTFVITTAAYVGLAVFALCRVTRHLQGNEEALRAVTTHVLVPLLGRKRKEDSQHEPAPLDVRLI